MKKPDIDQIRRKFLALIRNGAISSQRDEYRNDLYNMLEYISDLEDRNHQLQADIDEHSFTPEPPMGPWS